jgi:Tol biopolymer transport system component
VAGFEVITEDMWLLAVSDGEQRQPRVLLSTKFYENFGTFSPDGRWLAYESLESGRAEIYIQPYPGPGARVQVSPQSGMRPVWAPSGRELYYRTLDKMMAVPIETKPTLQAGSPRVVFEGRYWQAGHD